MNLKTTRTLLSVCFIALAPAAAPLFAQQPAASATSAAAAPTSGRLSNPAPGEYIRNAQVNLEQNRAGLAVLAGPAGSAAKTIERVADATLKVAEMMHGDTLRYTLLNGETRTFVLESTRAWIVEKIRGGTVYAFECQLRADGQPVTLRRFACTQESFYEPWVINGVRLWLSSSAAIFAHVPIRLASTYYKFDEVDAMFAFQDATLPICPEPMRPWFPLSEPFIDVATCYNGDDTWLGPFVGRACHVGLDINMPKGTPLYAPIDFDDNWFFSSDHRWRAVRRWPNGDIWGLQSHHVERLLISEGTPVRAGQHYAEGAGKAVGSHEHSHFEFRVGPGVLNRGYLGGVELDPWILFWQIFENYKEANGSPRVAITPLAPVMAGKVANFSASIRGFPPRSAIRYYWTFGDGGCSHDAAPTYTFAAPGVFPVTLVVEAGNERAAFSQHVTVNGDGVRVPALALEANDDVSFERRPGYAADVYGWPVRVLPHTLRFAVAPGGVPSRARTVDIINRGKGVLNKPKLEVTYEGEQGWLRVSERPTEAQKLEVSVNPGRLGLGRYSAAVAVTCPGALNARQTFRVEMHVRESPRRDEVIVDDRDERFYVTPFAWVGHQFRRPERAGFARRYLTNGMLQEGRAIARFTPDLAAGRYEVSVHPQFPTVPSELAIRIRHAKGEQTMRHSPTKTGDRRIGVFEFEEGVGGFLEISGADSTGLAVADAIIFRRLPDVE